MIGSHKGWSMQKMCSCILNENKVKILENSLLQKTIANAR